MKRYLILVLTLGVLGSMGCSERIDPAAEKTALGSTQAWLGLVDNEKYAESWEEAADHFKTAIGQERWQETARAVRTPLGRTTARELKTRRYATSLPGAPDGEYLVVQYRTSFEHKRTAVETITMKLEQDGKWRATGYFIK